MANSTIKPISQEEVAKLQVEGNLPDKPSQAPLYGGKTLTPQEIKAWYDKLPKLIVKHFNDFVKAIPGVTDGKLDENSLAAMIQTNIQEGHSLKKIFEDITTGAFSQYLKITNNVSLEKFFLTTQPRLASPIIRVRKEQNLLEIDSSIYEDTSFIQFVPYLNGEEIPLRIVATEKRTTFDLNIIEEEFTKGINTIAVIAIPDPINEAATELHFPSTASNTAIIETGHKYLDGYWLMNNDIDLSQFVGLEEEVSFKFWGINPNGDGGTIGDKIEVTSRYIYSYYTDYSGEYRKTSLYDSATNYWSGGFNRLWFDKEKVSERLYRFVTSNGFQNYKFVEKVESAIENLGGETEQLYHIADDLIAADETTAKRVDICEKRITNMEKGLPADRYITDNSTAYIKNVPTNACPYAGVVKVGGMTKKSDNLIPFTAETTTKKGVTFTVESDGTIVVNGAVNTGVSGDYVTYSVRTKELKAGKSYCVSSGISSYDSNEYSMILQSTNGAFTTKYAIKNGTVVTPTEDGIANVWIYVYQGSTLNNVVFKPMLNEGTSALPYESYYEGIRDAKVTAIESVGANRAFIPDATASGSNQGYSYYEIGNIEMPSGTYTLSADYVHTGTQQGMLSVREYDGSETLCQNAIISPGTSGKVQATFTVPSGMKGFRLYIYSNVSGISDATRLECSNFMVARGETALPYYPHRSPYTFDIPTEVQALDGYGEGAGKASNGIVWKNGEVWYEKRCKKTTLTADKTIYRDAYAPNYRFGFNIEDKAPSVGFIGNMVSNIAVKPDAVTTPAAATEYSIAGMTGSGAVYVIIPNCASVADAIAYLNENPIELCYELQTPEIFEIDDLITMDNRIEVEGGGTLTFVNEHGAAVPSTILYQVKGE